ncbi:MAG: hypothetical protein R3F53_19555 [Gammaproteobacteria bacterium]
MLPVRWAGEDSDRPDLKAPTMDHVCLQVQPGMPRLSGAHLQQQGVEIGGNAATRYGALGPGPSLYFSDPEGNRIELKGPG